MNALLNFNLNLISKLFIHPIFLNSGAIVLTLISFKFFYMILKGKWSSKL